MPGQPSLRLAPLALTRAALAYAALTVVSLLVLWLARPLSFAPSPYLCAIVGPPAWLVWGVNGFLPFAVGSGAVLFMLVVTLLVSERTRSSLVLAAGRDTCGRRGAGRNDRGRVVCRPAAGRSVRGAYASARGRRARSAGRGHMLVEWARQG